MVDPDQRTLTATSDLGTEQSELRPSEDGLPGRYVIAPEDHFLPLAERLGPGSFACGQQEVLQPRSLFDALRDDGQAPEPSLFPAIGAAISSLHQASIGVDTDNEFFHRKWGMQTTEQYQTKATNFLAAWFAGMTVMYERDVLVRLLQGTTFLRTPPPGNESNYTTDPWNAPPKPSLGASFEQLDEMHNYWAANYGAIPRAVATLISGKGSNSFYSGTAWYTALCRTDIGYSVGMPFVINSNTPAVSEIKMLAHEIGHNFGSPHTHCYTPTPVDTCYSGDPGANCYSGATSCPAPATINGVANVTGTIMSYCHILGGCTASLVFHPATVTKLQPRIQEVVGQCIFPAPTFTVSAVSPNHGPTAGGTPITITGSNIVAGGSLAVSVGGAPATSVTRQNSTTITATAPAHATGTVSIAVTNGDGLLSPQTLANSYFYSPPASASSFYSLPPCRVVDTRNADGPTGGPALQAASDRTFTVTTCGVPATAKAISANLTIAAPAVTGSVSVFPGNAIYLGTNEISFAAGVTRANNAVIELATNGAGTIKVRNLAAAAVHFVMDVNGYFE